MCTVLLPPDVNPIAVKYIISYHISVIKLHHQTNTSPLRVAHNQQSV